LKNTSIKEKKLKRKTIRLMICYQLWNTHKTRSKHT